MLISYSIYKAIGKQKIQVIKSAFGDQVFHGLFKVDKKISYQKVKLQHQH